jgi:hypothetical protein
MERDGGVVRGSDGTRGLRKVKAEDRSRLVPESLVQNAYLIGQRLDRMLQVCHLCFDVFHLPPLLLAFCLVIDSVCLSLAGELGFGASTLLLSALGGRVGGGLSDLHGFVTGVT